MLGVRMVSQTMSNRIRKTEHAGAKNGGGYWGKRDEAKALSKKIRRAQSRQMEESGAAEYLSSHQGNVEVTSDEKANEK